jgi:transcription initiation factor IIE alpha subunit
MSIKGNLLAIYNLFVQHRELNDFDIERLSKINPNSIRPTRLKLEELGIIKRTNIKKKATKGEAKDSRGKYTIFKIVREIDTNNIKKKKHKNISKNLVSKKLKSLRQKIKTLQKQLNLLIQSIN